MLGVKLFAEDVAREIKSHLPAEMEDMECRVTEQRKNNGVVMTGILFRLPERSVSPLVYMEPHYEKLQHGHSMEHVLDGISEEVQRALDVKELEIDFTDYGAIKDHITVALINTESNRRDLKTLPHRTIEDLSVICRIEIPLPGKPGCGSVKVTDAMLEQWGISSEELFAQALDNAKREHPPVLLGMNTLLEEMLEAGAGAADFLNGVNTSADEMMYVLTNRDRNNGASVLAYPGVTEKVADLFPQGYHILPSSVHEVIVLPKGDGITMTAAELGKMVREINREQVARQERLSDCAYEYDREKGRIVQMPESVERKKEMVR